MKQKIVVKVFVSDQKSRSKALKIAVGVSGVIESARLGGNDKSQIEIVGDGVHAVELVALLRKKMRHAEIVSVSAVGGEKKPEEKKEEPPKVQQILWPYNYSYSVPQMVTVHEDPYYYRPDPTTCSIM